MKQVTVIIPNYNGKEYLMECIDSVLENTKIPVDIIVADNGSQDGSAQEALLYYPKVNVIFLGSNFGFSRAVNEGIRVAKTPYVLLLNNDTKITPGFVEHLLRRIKSNPELFSVEAKMLQYHAKHKIDSAGTFYNCLGWARARGKDKPAQNYNEAAYTFASCAGAAIYRKSVFEKIGLFDETFFAYLEDIDIGYRARIHGCKNAYEPKAKVYHVGSASSGSRYNAFKVKISARNNIYLLHKNMPWMQMMINLPFLAAGFGIKTLFFMKKGFGKEYIEGLKEGIGLSKQRPKAKFQKKYWMNYLKIQKELWTVVF